MWHNIPSKSPNFTKIIMTKKVTFILSADIVADATEGLLLGEFNNWDKETGFSLKKQKDGSLKTTLPLEAGKTYEYRYLLNDGRWVNDGNAASYTHVHGFAVDNCVITVPATEEEASVPAAAPKAKAIKPKTATEPKPAKEKKDDLTKIEGVGKKIAELLTAENIISFEDLSKATAKTLKDILEAAGSRFKVHNPTSWPKQAKLAASGKWDELKKLQEELKGGK